MMDMREKSKKYVIILKIQKKLRGKEKEESSRDIIKKNEDREVRFRSFFEIVIAIKLVNSDLLSKWNSRCSVLLLP